MESKNISKNIENNIMDLYSLANYSLLNDTNIEKANSISLNNLKNYREKNIDLDKEKSLSKITQILDNKLRNYINTYISLFELYKQKMDANKMTLLKILDPEIKSLTINQLLQLMISIQNNYIKTCDLQEKVNNTIKKNEKNKINNIEKIFNLLNGSSFDDINKENNVENRKKEKVYDISKYKGIDFTDPTKICHSPSPLIFKKNESKQIIDDNKNVDNQIDFSTPQKKENNF